MAVIRVGLGKKVRFDVFKRDGFACQYCGAVPPSVLLQVDHIIPVAAGGDNHIDNLITACQPCNLGKGATGLDSVPQSLREKAEEIKEREEQLAEYNGILQQARDRIERDCWAVANCFLRGIGQPENSIGSSYYKSIRVFVERSGSQVCIDAMDVALAKFPYGGDDRVFRYFCGVMWKIIKESRSSAFDIPQKDGQQ